MENNEHLLADAIMVASTTIGKLDGGLLKKKLDEALSDMERFAQKYKRAFAIAKVSPPPDMMMQLLSQRRTGVQSIACLCAEGLLWHAFKHENKKVAMAIVNSVLEELAAGVLKEALIHPAFVKKARDMQA
ncbi:unnamed protein product [Symbiodinium sp. CCMP2592]|nr:unnamed protein product [Symbiodinium sp. CCMP2592]CAE7264553.1 unnamed protein product [Symbiodinium sp. CCMP2592]CAE7324082.1 unnamed protein product [Symbiodinium sp. CCMP2592]CAE7432467.1 unnamed protein product [Symbiodinium sp. CCMP2592]CAE7834436.1 unnamed protein product [Symbiodinium sp. CCMP2592]